MFKSLKIYKGQTIDLDLLLCTFVDFGYRRQNSAQEEGDFSRNGGMVDIYPATFDCPLRIEFDYNKIAPIDSYTILTGKVIWKHNMVIILPIIKSHSSRSS
ncbi:MAG: hypothetical protein PHY46_03160, partial [Candidatus Omnitrophica bacterium]|nr:hypothetical protein [Candidatus Omnitrophota bacterium]